MDGLLSYIVYCALAPMQDRTCGAFWYYVMAACFTFAACVAAWFAIGYVVFLYRQHKKVRAALAAETQRNMVNHEAIKELTWPE